MHTPVETTGTPDEKADRRALLIAAIVSLLFHAAAILGLSRLAHGQSPPHPMEVTTVQLVSEPAAEPRANDPQPQEFAELPPNRADAAPDKPEFLSNVTSRARDREPGGHSDLPKTPNAGDIPQVNPEPGGDSHPSTTPPQTPQAGTATGSSTAQDPSSAGMTPAPSKRAREAQQSGAAGAASNYDIHQPEVVEGDGNAALTGDISLNTTAWDFAPWLEHYKRQLLQRWMAPPAYYLGLLRDGGWVVMEVEISPSGQMLRCDQLARQGHQSLVDAADNAVRYLAPIEPLPKDFPEPTLILRIRMIYPKIIKR